MGWPRRPERSRRAAVQGRRGGQRGRSARLRDRAARRAAQGVRMGRSRHQCESCDVVLQAAEATQAYQKAVAWGTTYAAEPPSAMRLLAVSHWTTISEALGGGPEIRWEAGCDTP